MRRVLGIQKEVNYRVEWHRWALIFKNAMLFAIRLCLGKDLTPEERLFLAFGLERLLVLNGVLFLCLSYTLLKKDVDVFRNTIVILMLFLTATIVLSIQTMFELLKADHVGCLVFYILLFVAVASESVFLLTFYKRIGFVSTGYISTLTRNQKLTDAYRKRNRLTALCLGYLILLSNTIIRVFTQYFVGIPQDAIESLLVGTSIIGYIGYQISLWINLVLEVVLIVAIAYRINEESKTQRKVTIALILILEALLVLEFIAIGSAYTRFNIGLVTEIIYNAYAAYVVWQEYRTLDLGLKDLLTKKNKKKRRKL